MSKSIPPEPTKGEVPERHAGADRRPAAFLDRDGVINVDTGYLFRLGDMRFTPTAAEGIRLLNGAGYAVVVVTNQSGIARGLFTLDHLDRLHDFIQASLIEQGAHIDAFYHCPYHPAGTVPQFAREHEDRKPAPGMILRAIDDLAIDRRGSFLIGDKPGDIEAARRAGLPGLLVPTDTCDLAAVVRAQLGRAGSVVEVGVR